MAKTHCRIEFMKHVLPMLRRPTGNKLIVMLDLLDLNEALIISEGSVDFV